MRASLRQMNQGACLWRPETRNSKSAGCHRKQMRPPHRQWNCITAQCTKEWCIAGRCPTPSARANQHLHLHDMQQQHEIHIWPKLLRDHSHYSARVRKYSMGFGRSLVKILLLKFSGGENNAAANIAKSASATSAPSMTRNTIATNARKIQDRNPNRFVSKNGQREIQVARLIRAWGLYSWKNLETCLKLSENLKRSREVLRKQHKNKYCGQFQKRCTKRQINRKTWKLSK